MPDVGQLRQLEQAATPGPWVSDAPMMSQNDERYVGMLPHGDGYRHVMAAPDAETAALIAAARNALPALLDIAEAAQACLTPGFGDLTHEQAVARTDALADALARLDTEGE